MATRERKGMLKITETQAQWSTDNVRSNNCMRIHFGKLLAHLSACEPIYKYKFKMQTLLLSVIRGYLFEVSNIC
jgi:hypothetical protein